ncbi:MAG: APC family permease [Ktedonobacteraceae bacterium]
MPHILGTLDMTAVYLVAIFFIVNAVSAAGGGAAGFTYWLVCGLTFFIPCAIATAQLGVMFPHEGSLYNWTHKALGGYWSFFIGFCAWFPGVLVIVSGADGVVSCIQALNANWLAPAYQQGFVIIGIILLSGIISVQRFRTVQNIVNVVIGLTFLAVVLIGLSGAIWLLKGQPSATSFNHLDDWLIKWGNPNTANIGLFGTITLAYLGTEVPLNMGGEISGRKVVIRHLLWGTLLVFVGYLVTTFTVAVVQGPTVVANSSNPVVVLVGAVDMVLGKFAGSVTALCITAFFIIVPVVYNYAFARLLLVAGIDRRLPVNIGRINKHRVPANAIIFQTIITVVLTAIIFFAVPYVAHLGKPEDLANEVYFVVQAGTTLVWAISCAFFFVNLAIFYFRDPKTFHLQRIFPMPVLVITSIVGPIACAVAIVDTLLNSWIVGLIPNSSWWYIVGGLTLGCIIVAAIGSMLANSEAAWQDASQQ